MNPRTYDISILVGPLSGGDARARHIGSFRLTQEALGKPVRVLLQPYEDGCEACVRTSSAGPHSTMIKIVPRSEQIRTLTIWRTVRPGRPVLWTLLVASGATWPIVMPDGLEDALCLLASILPPSP
jgi:hypothetical protein